MCSNVHLAQTPLVPPLLTPSWPGSAGSDRWAVTALSLPACPGYFCIRGRDRNHTHVQCCGFGGKMFVKLLPVTHLASLSWLAALWPQIRDYVNRSINDSHWRNKAQKLTKYPRRPFHTRHYCCHAMAPHNLVHTVASDFLLPSIPTGSETGRQQRAPAKLCLWVLGMGAWWPIGLKLQHVPKMTDKKSRPEQ